jgi:ribonuclease HI
MLFNNLTKLYALFQGLINAKSLNLQNLIVIGDSLIIIRNMIRQIHLTFSKLVFYHVKRENNKEVDHLVNLATLKKEGCLALNNI